MRVAVVGSRIFENWDQLKETLDKIIHGDSLISGGAVELYWLKLRIFWYTKILGKEE